MICRVIFISILVVKINIGQSSLDKPIQQQNFNLITELSTDAICSIDRTFRLIKSPFNFNSNEFIFAGFIIATTGASFSIDNDIRRDVLKTKGRNLDEITYYGEKFGRPVYASVLSVFLYMTGLLGSNDYMKETGQILAEAMICNGIFTKLLKETLGRARPFTGESYKDISPFEFEFAKSENSLPSGHTSTAFTVATVLSERFKNVYASLALYGMASLTAFQRIYSDVHWFSDVLLGAALGTFIGLKIVSLHEKDNLNKRNFNMNIFPQINRNTYGVGFSFNF